MPHWDSNVDGAGEDDSAASDEVLQQTNKRLTLNLLSQGAAMHTFLTSHHLVRDELEAIRRGLTRQYDMMAASFSLNYFLSEIILFYGLPSIFWRRVDRPSHPFHRHRLLATHGLELWRASKRYLQRCAWRRWIVCLPFFHSLQMFMLMARVAWAERGKKEELARLVEEANAQIWGIDRDRLDAELTRNVAFGFLREPKTAVGQMTRQGAIGYGGVEWRRGQFQVIGKAWNWPLVSHELTKGAVELIFLHGLNKLDDETYELVTDEADQIEYETWMLQAGSEMWRRLLAVVPEGRALSEMLMHIARLEPESLEQLMLAVVEEPARARVMLQELA